MRKARKNSDTVIVHLHWGTELQKCPNEAQLSLAPKLVAAGADVDGGRCTRTSCSAAATCKNGYVSYGLGNFVFYNSGPETGRTGVLTLTINGRKVLKDQWTPAPIQGGVPIPITGAGRHAGRQRLEGAARLRGPDRQARLVRCLQT